MIFEVMAISKEVTEKSLRNHIAKLEEEDVVILKKEFDEIHEIEKPFPNIEKAYSQIVEVELEVKNFNQAIDIVLNYGPTMVEILGPDKINLTLKDAQDSLNAVAGMMHKFLEAGVGGVVIVNPDRE